MFDISSSDIAFTVAKKITQQFIYRKKQRPGSEKCNWGSILARNSFIALQKS